MENYVGYVGSSLRFDDETTEKNGPEFWRLQQFWFDSRDFDDCDCDSNEPISFDNA